MNKNRISEQDRAETMWLEWFQTLKLNHPDQLVIFFNTLSEFTLEYPEDANRLTVEDLQAILLDEI